MIESPYQWNKKLVNVFQKERPVYHLDSREKGTQNIFYETHLSPSGSQCIDLSDELAPNHTCICRMGLVMEGGRCIIRPPTTPASNIIVTLEPEKAETAAFLTSSASFVLIGFVTGGLKSRFII